MDNLECCAKFRYRQEDKEVTLKRVDDTHVMVYCKNPIKVIRIKRKNGKNSNDELNIKEILEYNSLKDIMNEIENH